MENVLRRISSTAVNASGGAGNVRSATMGVIAVMEKDVGITAERKGKEKGKQLEQEKEEEKQEERRRRSKRRSKRRRRRRKQPPLSMQIASTL